MAGVAALAVILVAAGSVAVVLSARGAGTHAPGGRQSAGIHNQGPETGGGPGAAGTTAAVGLAARWVDRQVSHDAVIACDRAMCRALAGHGFPGRRLKLIGPGAPYPVRAQVVIETPAIRNLFGARRNAELAPAVLARIGRGSAAISIRVIAPRGAAAYQAQLRADIRQRRGEGAGLLTSSQVMASPIAREELISGQVDARLIVVLTALASVHPIDVLGFGTAFAGASPGLPLRTAELALDTPAAHLTRLDYLRFLLTQLDAEPDVYRPLTAEPVRGGTGTHIFQMTFPAPSPLGLLG